MHVRKSFVFANFNYRPVVWMFCGKNKFGKLETLQERALSTIFFREVTQLKWVNGVKWPVISED